MSHFLNTRIIVPSSALFIQQRECRTVTELYLNVKVSIKKVNKIKRMIGTKKRLV